MAYCGPRALPLSTFLSWPASDQDAALAWQQHEAQRCGGCGTHPHDWDADHGGDRHAYVAVIHECPGCVALERTRDAPEMKEGRGRRIRMERRN
ncbi:MAG TPA: hypothetical protein VF069_05945 [Streptosporangiaceae bacterium]